MFLNNFKQAFRGLAFELLRQAEFQTFWERFRNGAPRVR